MKTITSNTHTVAPAILDKITQEAAEASVLSGAQNEQSVVGTIAAEEYISALIEDRETWEKGSLKASLDELYGLLAKCVGLYEMMARDDENGERLRNELEAYCKENGFKFKGDTHTIVKIVRSVFNNDRRRYSSYGKALRIAIAEGKSKTEVVGYLRSKNGIDGVIKSVTTTGSADTLEVRATKVWEKLKSAKLACVSSDKLKQVSDQAHINKPVVLLATQLANGEFEVHQVIKKSTIVNSTYATFFKEEEHAQVTISKEAAITKKVVDRDVIRKQLALVAA